MSWVEYLLKVRGCNVFLYQNIVIHYKYLNNNLRTFIEKNWISIYARIDVGGTSHSLLILFVIFNIFYGLVDWVCPVTGKVVLFRRQKLHLSYSTY